MTSKPHCHQFQFFFFDSLKLLIMRQKRAKNQRYWITKEEINLGVAFTPHKPLAYHKKDKPNRVKKVSYVLSPLLTYYLSLDVFFDLKFNPLVYIRRSIIARASLERSLFYLQCKRVFHYLQCRTQQNIPELT